MDDMQVKGQYLKYKQQQQQQQQQNNNTTTTKQKPIKQQQQQLLVCLSLLPTYVPVVNARTEVNSTSSSVTCGMELKYNITIDL